MPEPETTAPDHEWDTLNLFQPSPNCRFAGFIGAAPAFHPHVEPIDFVALQQLPGETSDGDGGVEETIIATRVVPIIIENDGRIRVLTAGGFTPPGDPSFACVAGDEARCMSLVTQLIGLQKAAASVALKVAAAAVSTTTEAPADGT